MSLLEKNGWIAIVVICLVGFAYLTGRYHGRETALKAAVAAYQAREKINETVQNLDPVALCRALGGVPYECAALMRGVVATDKFGQKQKCWTKGR